MTGVWIPIFVRDDQSDGATVQGVAFETERDFNSRIAFSIAAKRSGISCGRPSYSPADELRSALPSASL